MSPNKAYDSVLLPTLPSTQPTFLDLSLSRPANHSYINSHNTVNNGFFVHNYRIVFSKSQVESFPHSVFFYFFSVKLEETGKENLSCVRKTRSHLQAGFVHRQQTSFSGIRSSLSCACFPLKLLKGVFHRKEDCRLLRRHALSLRAQKSTQTFN